MYCITWQANQAFDKVFVNIKMLTSTALHIIADR